MALKNVLTIDLAGKFSAVCIMNPKGVVLAEFDSWGKHPAVFVDEIAAAAKKWKVSAIVVEDVPYGLSKQFMIKPVLRLQGMLISELYRQGLLDITVFLNPATWQRTFEGVFGGKEKGALAAATVFSYVPPNMLEIHADEIPEKGKERAKVRAQLKKASTDYVDSFLMAKFTLEFTSVEEMLEKSGIQPVTL